MGPLRQLIWIAASFACILAAQDDPPGRVARISYTYGSVSFRPGEVDDWFPADFNRPLITGDHVFANPGATVELEIGDATILLGANSLVDILNLDDSNVQLRMTQGLMIVRVRSLGDQGTFEVDTPNLAFSVQQTGDYRIEVPPNSTSTLTTVRAGAAQLTGSDQTFAVQPGEQVEVDGVDQPNYQRYAAPPYDTLENFLAQQEQRDQQSVSARYCSREVIGYQDLDKYGSWRSTPDYGMAWVPNNTPGGWAPYHTGHWLWVDPWGWTWVDDAPWGFAPFHYGRWAYVGGGWAWVPGPVSQRPVYAPALVVWVGGDVAAGGVAWFPLGPREVYVPAFQASPAYVNRVNVTNTVIVNNINITNVNVTNVNYVNRAAPGAVMAVQRDAFVSARPVQTASVAVRPDAVRSAPVIAALPVTPTRASVVRAPAGANVVKPPAALETRPVIAKKAPPPPPVPFAQKQAALAANGGRPLDKNQVQQLRRTQPASSAPPVRQVQHAVSAGPPATQTPVRHAGQPSSQPPQRAPTPAAAAPSSQPPPSKPVPKAAEPAPREERPAQPTPSPAVQHPPSAAPAPAKAAPKDEKREKDKTSKKDQKKDEKKDEKQE